MAEWMDPGIPWKKLQLKWEQTKTGWNDPKSWEFERTFIIPLAEQMQRTQDELERLTQVIEQAQRAIK